MGGPTPLARGTSLGLGGVPDPQIHETPKSHIN